MTRAGVVRSGVLAAMAAGLFSGAAHASTIVAVEPNNTLATAQDVDAFFTLDADANIQSSTTIPHVTIQANGNGTFDYYKFTVANTGQVILDIDLTTGSSPFLDTAIFLYNSAGTLIDQNGDDSLLTDGAGGSTTGADSFQNETPLAAGTYVIGVAQSGASGDPGGITGAGTQVQTGQHYTLQISVAGHALAAPEPATLGLISLGSLMIFHRRRRAAAR